MSMDMSPRPKRPPMVTCGNCGRANDTSRGSKYCWYCNAELSAPLEIAPAAGVIAVPFLGGHIPCVEIDGEPMVILKPVSDLLGLSWAPQHAKLSADQAACITFIVTQIPGDAQSRRHMAVSLETFTVWLARLQPSRVKPEARKTVTTYQREAGRVLRDHFFGAPQRPVRPSEMSKADWIRQALEIEEAREQLARENAELKPKAHSWDTLASARGDFSVSDAAKILTRDPAISIGRDRLFTAMAEMRWVYRQQADGRWRAYQDPVDIGRLSELPMQYENKQTGQLALAAPQVRITVKGLAELHRRLGGSAPLAIEDGE